MGRVLGSRPASAADAQTSTFWANKLPCPPGLSFPICSCSCSDCERAPPPDFTQFFKPRLFCGPREVLPGPPMSQVETLA